MKYANVDYYTNPGSPYRTVYAPKVEPNGSMKLIKAGVENVQDYINSFKESTDINVVIKRITAGEIDLLRQRTGSYGDFTKMPQTFAEALQLQIDSNRLFESLPAAVKKEFDGDPNQFFAQSGTKEWFDKISPVLPDEVKAAIMPPAPAPVDEKEGVS